MRLAATPEKSSPLRSSLTPAELHSAYQLPTTAAEPQTIAIVDAYNDPDAAKDLGIYELQFGLLPCEGCFTQVNQEGQSSSSTRSQW